MIEYRRMLSESAEPEYAAFSSKLNPGKEGIIGVRTPRIREIANLIINDDWRTYLEDEPSNFEEEELKGLVIATAKMDIEERIILTEGFMHYIDNWATCDLFCSAWRFRVDEEQRAWDYFSSLIESGDEFRMRVSVVMRMSNFPDEDRVDALMEDIATHDHRGYYYRMGAAWALSSCYVRFPGKTMALLESNRLEPWTHNRTIQKIKESLRVPPKDKELLTELRRKGPL